MQLILCKFQHLLEILKALLECLSPTWNPTSHCASKPCRSFLWVIRWCLRLLPSTVPLSWIEVIIVGHVELLRGSQVYLRLVMVMVVMGMMMVTMLLVRGLLLAAAWLLRWLSRLVVIVMVWLRRRGHVACCLRARRNVAVWIHHIWIWALTMDWSSRAGVHPFVICICWGSLRRQRFIIAVGNCSVQTYFLGVIQKVWKGRFLPVILISSLSVTSLSSGCWVTSFLSVAFLARLWNRLCRSRIVRGRCWGIFLALSHRYCSFWNRCHILSIETRFILFWIGTLYH